MVTLVEIIIYMQSILLKQYVGDRGVISSGVVSYAEAIIACMTFIYKTNLRCRNQ